MFAGGLLLMVQSASAQSWTSVGSTCIPDDESVGLYSFDNGTFQFGAGKTGTIKARCHITNPLDGALPTWNTLTIGYRDPDGIGLNDQVFVQLVRVARGTGVVTVIKSFDSNAFTSVGSTVHSVNFTHTFDFTNYAYYLALNVDRASTADSTAVWFARLSTT